MPTFLDNLKLSELSFVDKGANQHASVTIFKRADYCPPEDEEEKKKLQRKRLDRVTALQERLDLAAADIAKLSEPARLKALKAKLDALQAKASSLT